MHGAWVSLEGGVLRVTPSRLTPAYSGFSKGVFAHKLLFILTAGKFGVTVNGTTILVLLTAPQDLQLKETKNE
jgi:hypothetical protein